MRSLRFLIVFLVSIPSGAIADGESRGSSLTPVPVTQTGSAVTIFDRAELEARGFPRVLDLLREVPSVHVSEAGPLGSNTQVRIRGAEGNHTLVYLDGIEIGSPAASGEFDFAHLLSAGLEQVEVVRGPLSGVFGGDAIGGAIILTTREGRGLEAELLAAGGSRYTSELSSFFGVGGDRGSLGLTLGSLRTQGTDVSRPRRHLGAPPDGHERDGYKNLTLHLNNRLRPTENLDFEGVLRWIDAESEFDDDSDFDSILIDDQRENDTRTLAARVATNLRLFDDRLTQRAELSILDQRDATTDRSRPCPQTICGRIGGFQSRRWRALYTISGAESVGPADLRLTARYEREESEIRNQDRVTAGFSGPLTPERFIDTTIHSGVFEGRMGFDDRFFVAGSYRFDGARNHRNGNTYRITGSAEILPGWRLRASGGSGITYPSLFDQFGTIVELHVPNPDLEPETSTGWDIGLEGGGAHWGVVWGLGAGYFESDLEEEIRFGPLRDAMGLIQINPVTGFPDFGLTNESGRARRRGFEFEWAAQRGPWELRGSYAYVRTREEFVSIDTSDPSGPRSSSYHREVRRPRHQGSLRIHWAGERLDLSGGVRVQGSMSDFNFSQGFDGISNRQTLGGFALVDARASYRIHEQLELFARVENALDKDYEEIVGFDAPGFGAFGGLRWRWRRK